MKKKKKKKKNTLTNETAFCMSYCHGMLVYHKPIQPSIVFIKYNYKAKIK